MEETIRSSSPEPAFQRIERDAETDEYALLLHRVRSDLLAVMASEGISRKDLSRRLGVNASVVTRVLDPTNDVLLSTLFDFAWQLRRVWTVRLQPRNVTRETDSELSLIDTFDEPDEESDEEMVLAKPDFVDAS